MAKRKTNRKVTKKKSSTRSPRNRRVEFSYDAPDANRVAVTGSFCNWDQGVALKKNRSGRWKATLTLPPGNYEYRFLVDGEWRDDPTCAERSPSGFGTENCILRV